MRAGAGATPAVRAGLAHPDPTVRVGCCQVLDHFLDDDAVPELIENMSHPDPQVRSWAVHALACDRCKEGACRPGEGQFLADAIRMLSDDPARIVRQQAAALVGLAVHRDPAALAAIERAHRHDPHPVVRKIAGWFVPGGPRYEAIRPKPVRVAPANR
jgi:HEAT repeat protein